MATSRITGTNETVRTFGTGRDYSNFQTWETAVQADLVSGTYSEALECYDDETSFSSQVVINSTVANASYRLLIRPATGEGHDGTSNNGFYVNSTADSRIFDVNDDYTTIQDLILAININTASTRYITYQSGAAATESSFIGVIFAPSTNSGSGVIYACYNNNNNACYAINCLANDIEAIAFLSTTSGVFYVYNCTAEGCGTAFNPSTASTMKVINCLESNNSTGFSGTFASGSDYNAAEDTASPDSGSNNRINQTFTFVNAAGADFHLSSSDVGALGFGVSLASDGNFAFDDDIDGETITDWSIGFDSHVAATIPIFMYHYQHH